MFKRWLSWFVFVAHTTLFVVVVIGGHLSPSPNLPKHDLHIPPLTERLLNDDARHDYGAGALYLLDESDQIEELSEQERSEPPPQALSQPKPAWVCSPLSSRHIESHRNRGPPQPLIDRALSSKDRWLAVSLPTRGPPYASSPVQG